jgi:hypothetical protein
MEPAKTGWCYAKKTQSGDGQEHVENQGMVVDEGENERGVPLEDYVSGWGSLSR